MNVEFGEFISIQKIQGIFPEKNREKSKIKTQGKEITRKRNVRKRTQETNAKRNF